MNDSNSVPLYEKAIDEIRDRNQYLEKKIREIALHAKAHSDFLSACWQGNLRHIEKLCNWALGESTRGEPKVATRDSSVWAICCNDSIEGIFIGTQEGAAAAKVHTMFEDYEMLSQEEPSLSLKAYQLRRNWHIKETRYLNY